MKKFKYIGDGMGVPGLPHEISDDEADALGVTKLLKAAVDNGSYREIEEQTPPEDLPQIPSSPLGDTGDDLTIGSSLELEGEGSDTTPEQIAETPPDESFEPEKRTAKKRKE